jgi:predicted dehydrogenase
VNFLILGQGRMGQRYSHVLRELYPAANLYLVDPREPAAKVSGANYFLSLESLQGNLQFLMAVDARPNLQRAESLRQLAAMGIKNIIVEKPHARSLAESQKMQDIQSEFGLKVMVPFYRDFSEHFAAETIQRLGGGRLVSISMQSGAIGIGCNGVHLIRLCNFLMSASPKSVWAMLEKAPISSPRGPQFKDFGGLIVLQYSDERKAILNLSAASNVGIVTDLQFENGRILAVETSKQSWRWFRGNPVTQDNPIYKTHGEQEIEAPFPYKIDLFELMKGGITSFIGGKPYPSLNQAHEVLRVVALAVESSKFSSLLPWTAGDPAVTFDFT